MERQGCGACAWLLPSGAFFPSSAMLTMRFAPRWTARLIAAVATVALITSRLGSSARPGGRCRHIILTRGLSPKTAVEQAIIRPVHLASTSVRCFSHQRLSAKITKSAKGASKQLELQAMTRRPLRTPKSRPIRDGPEQTIKAVSPGHSGSQRQGFWLMYRGGGKARSFPPRYPAQSRRSCSRWSRSRSGQKTSRLYRHAWSSGWSGRGCRSIAGRGSFRL